MGRNSAKATFGLTRVSVQEDWLVVGFEGIASSLRLTEDYPYITVGGFGDNFTILGEAAPPTPIYVVLLLDRSGSTAQTAIEGSDAPEDWKIVALQRAADLFVSLLNSDNEARFVPDATHRDGLVK